MPTIVADSRRAVKRAATLDAWTLASIRQEYRHKATAALVQQVDELAHLPLALRVACWGWLSALAIELGERCLAIEIADDVDGAA